VTGLDVGRRSPATRREQQAEWESRELMHAALLHQFGNGAVVRVGAVFERHVLEEVAAEVARRIQNIPRGRQFLEHRRARFLIEAVKQVVRAGSQRARVALLAEAHNLAALELRWLGKVGGDVLGAEFRTPAPSLVESAISRTPMLGRQFGEWFSDWVPRATEAKVVARVRAGMLAGETTPQIVRSLQGTGAAGYADGKLAESRRAIATIVRTTMTHTATVARDETFRENDDVVEHVGWIATLDLRTCPICAVLDGKTWPTNDAHPVPPNHPGCRCSLVPRIGPVVGKRAALGGPVDARTTYPAWLRAQSPADQDLVIGKAKAAAWRAGDLRFEQVVNDSWTRVRTWGELAEALGLPAKNRR
jgi:SPP1 gp7 family putative phage head morphogenesis protein